MTAAISGGLPTNRIKMAFSTTGTIAYDNWVSSFAAPSQVGQTVTGVTSGATGTIVAVNIITMYSHGSIDLEDITGTFIDNEVLVSAGGGEASVNGTLTGGLFMGNDALASPLLVDIEADYIADRIYAGNLYGNMYRALNIGEDMTPQVSMLFSFENNAPGQVLPTPRMTTTSGYISAPEGTRGSGTRHLPASSISWD
jgi:hypothetical protein